MSQTSDPLSSTLSNPLGDAAMGEAVDSVGDIFSSSVSGVRVKGVQQKGRIQNEIKGLQTSIDLQRDLVKDAIKAISEIDQEIGPIEANISMAEGLKV